MHKSARRTSPSKSRRKIRWSRQIAAAVSLSLVAAMTAVVSLGMALSTPDAAAAATAPSPDGRISLTYTPSASTVTTGSQVSYDYVIRNNATGSMFYNSLSDSSCSSIGFVSATAGSSQSTLAPGGSATFRCTKTLTATTTSTASVSYYYFASGWDQFWGTRTYSRASAVETVTVTVDPNLHPAFACTTPAVFVAAGQGTTQLHNQYQYPTGSSFIDVGAATMQYNAMAFNPKDNYLYAVSSQADGGTAPSPDSLLRIDANGGIENLGRISDTFSFQASGGFSSAGLKSNWLRDAQYGINAGAFSTDGSKFYVSDASVNGTGVVYVLDLAARTVSAVSSTVFRTNDFVYKDGYLWGIQNGTSTLLRYNLTNGAVTTYALTNYGITMPQATYGAAWVYGNGNLGFDDNNGTGYYQIAINGTSASPTGFTLVTTGKAPTSSNNDGANCIGVNSADLSVQKIGPASIRTGQPITWTMRISNNGPGVSSGGVLTDTVPSQFTNIQLDPAYANVCAVSGSKVTCATGVLNPGDTYDIKLTATAPSSVPNPPALANSATIFGNEADPNPGNNTGTSTVTVTSAIIDLSKTAAATATGPDANGNHTATYTIRVSNSGSGAGTYTQLTDRTSFSAGALVQSMSWSGGPGNAGATAAPADGTGAYLIGTAATKTLAAGATDTYTVTVVYKQSPSTGTTLTTCSGSPGDGLFNQAAVPEENSGNTSNNTACANPAPAIQVVKTVVTGGATGPGSSHTLTLNTSGAVDYYYQVRLPAGYTEPMKNVKVTDDRCVVPATVLSGDANSNALLDAGETWLYRCSQTLNYAVNGGSVTNTATASGTGNITNIGRTATDSATVTIPNPSASLIKSAAKPVDVNNNGVVDAGDTIQYSFTVTNTGNVDLKAIVINDDRVSPSSFPCAAGPLSPGASTTCVAPAVYTITAADQTAQSITNTATARADLPNGDTTTPTDDVVSNPSSTTTTVASLANLNVAKTVTSVSSTVNPDTGTFQVSYRITVTNSGGTPTTYGPLSDSVAFAPNLQVASASWTGQSAGSATGPGPYMLAAAGTTIGANATHSYLLTVTVRYGSSTAASACAGPNTGLYNSATIPNENGPTSDNAACATPPPAPSTGIHLTKTASTITDADGSGSVTVNDTITYSFSVQNTGTLTLNPVTVTDLRLASQNITISCAVSALAPGATTTCTTSAPYKLTQTDIDSGSVSNTATATGTPPAGYTPPTDNSSTTTPIPDKPSILLTKKASANDLNGDGRTDFGDSITYSFTVTNTGNVTLTNISISDPKLAGQTITCVDNSLAPLASTACTVSDSYPITAADVTAGNVTNTATTSGTTPTGGTVTDTASTSTPVVNPSVSLTKAVQSISDVNGNGRTDAGDRIGYSFVVTNTGNTSLTGIVITDPKVGDANCPATTLDPGASITCISKQPYTVTEADANAGSVDNTATVNGNPPSGTPVTTKASATTPAANPSITLTKTHSAPTDVNGNGRVDAGDTVTYSFIVTNTGNTALTAVQISDPKLIGSGVTVSCPSSNLAAGASMTCTSDAYPITAADATTGAVNNTATVAGNPPSGTAVTATATDQIPVESASIALNKMHTVPSDVNGNGRVDAGDTITYTFVVTNTGNVTLTGNFVSDPKLTAAGVTLTCPVNSLAPAASTTCTSSPYTITAAEAASGTVNNTATATGQPPVGTPVTATDDDTQPAVAPSYDLTKAVDVITDVNRNGRTDAGDTISYVFTIKNTGNTALSAISITDNMLSGPITCTTNTLPVGASTTCRSTTPYSVTAADLSAGSVNNTATSSAQPPTGTPIADTATATVPVQSASLTIDKTHDAPVDVNGNGRVDAGDTVVFHFLVTNTGTTQLSNLVISDPRLAAAGVTISCESTTLAPGASTVCTSTPKTITQATSDSGSLTNTASATASPPSGTPVSASDTDSFPTMSASVGIVKSVSSVTDANDNGRVDAGDVVNYRFMVTNTGQVDLTAVSVTDSLGIAVSCPATTLAKGISMICTASYTATTADQGTGAVDNTASVIGQPPLGNPVTSTSTASQPLVTASIELDKKNVGWNDLNGNGRIDTGDQIVYEFVVRNSGNLTVNNLTVSDPNVPGISCPVATLAPGESTTCTGTPATVSEAAAQSGDIVNTAVAQAIPAVGTPVTSTDTNHVPALLASMTLDKRIAAVADVNDNGRTDAGDTISYQFVVTNTGSAALSAVTVNDPMVGTISCPVSTLAAGASVTCTAAPYTITDADQGAGQVVNTASAAAQPVDGAGSPAGEPLSATDTETQLLSGAALSVDKSIAANGFNDVNGNHRTDAGDVITYQFKVSNDGALTINDIVLTDSKIGDVECPQDVLGPGTSMICTATYTVTTADAAAGSVTNDATVTGQPLNFDETPAGDRLDASDTVTTPTYSPSIAINKRLKGSSAGTEGLYGPDGKLLGTPQGWIDSNNNGRVDAGDHLQFEFVVTNTGDTTLTQLVVTDSKIGAVSCNQNTLAPGESTSCTGADKIITDASALAGLVHNEATVDGTPVDSAGKPVGDHVTATDLLDTPASQAAITLDKAIVSITDTNGNGRVDSSDVINYSFVLTNTGNLALTGVTLTDSIIPSAACPTTSLAAGESVTCTASYTIPDSDLTLNEVVNTATATGQPAYPDGSDYGAPVTATDTVKQPVSRAAVTLTKAGTPSDVNGDGLIGAGDQIAYTFTVTNTGNVALHDVHLSDPMLTVAGLSVSCPAGELAPGASMNCTASGPYAVTTADAQAGGVSNAATVIALPPTGTSVADDAGASVPAYQPAITLEKSHQLPVADQNGNGRIDAPDVVTYQFTVTNTGNIALANVVVNDPKVGSITCPSSTLDVGAAMTCTADYTITAADVDGGSIINNASVTGNPIVNGTPDTRWEVTATDTDSLDTEGSSIDLQKSIRSTEDITTADGQPGSDGRIGEGDVINYEFVVTNTGDLSLSGVELTDGIVQNLSCPQDALNPGESMTCTGSHTISRTEAASGAVHNTAVVSATPVRDDGTLTEPVSDSSSADQLTQQAEMTLLKTAASPVDLNGDGRDSAGDTINYTFTVTNTGALPLSNITITDQRLGLSGYTCAVGPVDPGESVQCSAVYTLTTADIDASTVVNIATAQAAPTIGNPVTATDDATSTLTGTPELTLSKSAGPIVDANGNGLQDAGDTISYSFEVTNTGSVTLNHIVIDDPKLGANFICTEGPLEPGASITCALTPLYTLTQDDVNAGEVHNLATATGASTAGDTPPADAQTTTPIAPASSLALVKSAGGVVDANGNGLQDAGDTISYTFAVTNNGNVDLTNVVINDPKLGLVNFLCAEGPLQPGQSATCAAQQPYVVTVADIDAQGVTNTATATGIQPDGALVPSTPSSTQTPLSGTPAITLEKTAGEIVDVNGDGIGAGDTISYSFTITNTGATTLNNVVLDDPKLGLSQVVCGTSTLAPGVSTTCQPPAYQLTLADINAGELHNLATVAGQGPGGVSVTASDTADVPIAATPGIDLVKHASAVNDSNPDGLQDAGDTIEYSFTVTNTGNVTLTGVTVTDPMVGAVTCQAESLEPGQSTVCLAAAYVLTQADIDSGNVHNTAGATGNPPLGTPPTASDEKDVSISPAPAIEIVKQAGPVIDTDSPANGTPDAGDTISYSFAVTNTGNVTLSDVVVTDPMLSAASVSITCPQTTLAPKQAMTCIAAPYALSQADLDAGEVTNTASATGNPPDGANPPADDSTTTTVLPGNPRIDLIKTASLDDTNGNGYADAGEAIAYSFQVTNTGTVTLNDLTIDDSMLSDAGLAVACSKTTLGAGESTTCTAQPYVVTQADIDNVDPVLTNVATATGTAPDGEQPTDTTNADIPKDQQPQLTIEKSVSDASGDGLAQIGEVLTYTFVVTNSGAVTMSNVAVTDQMLTDAGSMISCLETTLVPGASTSCTASGYVVTQADLDTGRVYNSATVAGTPPGSSTPVESNPSETATPTDQQSAIALVKSATLADADGDALADIGETIIYSFTVTNNGNTTVSSVTIDDPMLAAAGVAVTCPSGPLAPSASVVCTSAPYVVTQADVDAGSVPNAAVAKAITPTGEVPSDTGKTDTPTDRTPGLAMVKSSELADTNGDGLATLGEEITYRFTLTNTGAVTLTELSVNDTMLIAAGITVTCPGGPLAPGATVDCVSSAYTVTQADVDAGKVVNAARATGVTPSTPNPDNPDSPVPGQPVDSNDDTNTVPTTQTPQLSLVKTVADASGDGLASPGEKLTYTFELTNTGGVTISKLSVDDPKLTAAGIAINCPTDPLAPGQSAKCTSDAYVPTQSEVDAGLVENTATGHGLTPGGSDIASNPDTESIPVSSSSALTLLKTAALADANGNGLADVGEQITYSFLLTNTGEVTLGNVTVDDPKLGGGVSCPSTTLAVGAQMTCSGTPYVVTQADVDAGRVANQATASGSTPGGGETPSNPSSTTTPTPSGRSLALVKSSALNDTNGNGIADRGEQIDYSFTLTNTGELTLNDLTVDDQMLTAAGISVSCPSAPLAPGATVTCTAAPYVVTQADVEAGKVVNLATATGTTPPTDNPDDPGNPTPGTPVPSNPDDDEVPVAQTASITLTKAVDDQREVRAGDQLSYTFTVTNTGTVTVRNVAITDPMFPTAPACPTRTLAPGESVVCTAGPYTVTQADVESGVVHNQAIATADGPNTPVESNRDTVDVPTSTVTSMTLTKKALDASGDGMAELGESIHFEFVVTNTGARTINALTVDDPWATTKGLTISCPGTSLDPGVEMTCTSSDYIVTQADVDSGQVSNAATVKGEGPSGTPVETPPSETSTPTPYTPSLSLAKSVADASGDGIAQEGEQLTYTFVVTNNGTVTVDAVTIDDPMLSGAGVQVGFADGFTGTLEPGQSATATGSYTVSAADMTAGHVSNLATAHGEGPRGPLASPEAEATIAVETSSAPASPPAGSAPAEPDGGGSGPISGRPKPVIAQTGVDAAPMAALGCLLITVGVGTAYLGRRRHQNADI